MTDIEIISQYTPQQLREIADKVAERKEKRYGGRELVSAGLRFVADAMDKLDGDRDQLGRMVRNAWVRWAETQPDPKPSWLIPYDDLAEPDKEADRQIGEAIARWTLIGDAAHAASVRGKK